MAFQNFMNSVKLTAPPRNNFDLSHDRKFSMNMGQIVPCFLMDCLPGDHVNIDTTQLIRAMPMLAPIMHRELS